MTGVISLENWDTLLLTDVNMGKSGRPKDIQTPVSSICRWRLKESHVTCSVECPVDDGHVVYGDEAAAAAW